MPDALTERELNDRLCERVRPFLPPPPAHAKGGRPVADDRACFEGVASVPRNCVRWRHMPACYPSGVTCWLRHRDWTCAGVWHRAWKLNLGELAAAGRLDTLELVLDVTYVEAKKRTSGPASGGSGRAPRWKSSPTARASRPAWS